MKFYKSKIKPNKILHIIFKKSDFKKMNEDSRKDLIEPDQFIQLSTMKLKKGQSFKPHFHIWKNGEEKIIAQESWVVISGSVKCRFYDLDQKIISEPILEKGDCSVTLEGGHTYTILEENTCVYEFKTGPYKGQKFDKEFLNET